MRRDLILQRKKRRKQVAAGVTAALVAVAGTAWTYSYATEKKSAEDFSNTETVYVMTDNEGKETQRIVSEKGKLHYDGYSREILPAEVKIKYELNGKEISPEKLQGKSGALKIKIHYDTNPVAGVSVPMVAVSGMVTDKNHFNNVTVDHGKIIEDGNRIVIMAFGMPGVEENLRVSNIAEIPDTAIIEGEARDFELDGMYTFMTKEIFEEVNRNNAFNTGDLTSKIDEMTGGVKELKDGAENLNEGVSKLSYGAAALKEGTGTLKKGASDLNEGVSALKGGSLQLKEGAGQLNAGATELSEGFGKLTAGSNALLENTNTLAGAAAQVEAGSQQLSTGTGQLNDALTSITSNSSALNAGAVQLVNSVFAESSAKVTAALQKVNPMAPVITLTEENYQAVLGSIPGTEEVKAQLDSVEAFKAGLFAYTGGVDQAAQGAAELDSTVKTSFLPGVIMLKDGASAVAAGQSQLKSGIDGACEGADAINTGTETLVKGQSHLGEGIDMAAEGAAKLKDGSSLLYDKEDELLRGIAQLKEGTQQMKEGTVLLDEKINEELNKIKGSGYIDALKRTKDLRNAAKNYRAFGEKGNYESVTFIYKTQGILSENTK